MHNSNAINDPRIKLLMKDYGYWGYGMYWLIIEMLVMQADHKLEVGGNQALLIEASNSEIECVSDFINECIDTYHLFESDGVHFWSDLKDAGIFIQTYTIEH